MSLAHIHQTAGTVATGVTIDREAVLQALNLNPRDPKVQALVLVCQQYGLDPVLKHAVLISGNLYVTRDGLLHVAHRSGNLDGITVEAEGEDDHEWWAKVAVHVKGQTHPYTYRGRYPKSGQQKRYGPEMAVKCAEVMALRRAFGVTGIATVEEQFDQHDSAIAAEVVQPPSPDDPPIDDGQRDTITDRLNALPDDRRKAAKGQFVQMFGLPQHLRRSQVDEVYGWLAEIAGEGTGPDVTVKDTPDPDDYDAIVPSFVDPPARDIDSTPPATRFHEAVKAALPYVACGDSELRHRVVDKATDGQSEDWRTLVGDTLDAAVELLTQIAEGSLVVRQSSMTESGWLLDARGPADGPFVPDRLGELRDLIGQVKGLGEARAFLRAKRLADENGLACPSSFDELDGELLALLTAEVRAEAEAAA